MNSTLWKTIYILALLILAGSLLFAGAAQKSFWEDEAFSAVFAQKDTSELLQGLAWDVHPPLFLIMINQWGKVFGFDELGLRSLSILWALAALLLTYKLTLDLLGERAALIAITLMAFNPLILMFASNARYYSMAMFLALLASWGALRFKQPKQAGWLLVYVLSSAAFLYLLFAAAAVLVAANVWWLSRWLLQKKTRSAASLALWGIAQLAVVGLYLPGLRILQSVGGRFAQLAEINNWLVEIVKRTGYYAYVSAVGETLSPLNPLAWVGVILVLALVIYGLWKNWRSLEFWLPVVFVLLPAGANLLLTFNAAVSQTWQNLPYRALYVYPFLMIWLAAGLVRMKLPWAAGVGAVLLAVYALGIFNYFTNRQFLRPVYTVPWRSIFEQIQAESAPGELVVCGFGDSSCYYYSERYGFGQNDLNNWGNLARQTYPQIWYIQTNLGRGEAYGNQPALQQTFLEDMTSKYNLERQIDFAPQDSGIRRLKARFLNQEDYAYRVNLLRFMQR